MDTTIIQQIQVVLQYLAEKQVIILLSLILELGLLLEIIISTLESMGQTSGISVGIQTALPTCRVMQLLAYQLAIM